MKISRKQYQKLNQVLKKSFNNSHSLDYINHKTESEFYKSMLHACRSFGIELIEDEDGLCQVDKSKVKWAD